MRVVGREGFHWGSQRGFICLVKRQNRVYKVSVGRHSILQKWDKRPEILASNSKSICRRKQNIILTWKSHPAEAGSLDGSWRPKRSLCVWFAVVCVCGECPGVRRLISLNQLTGLRVGGIRWRHSTATLQARDQHWRYTHADSQNVPLRAFKKKYILPLFN
jgi:hypothetical protein